MPGRNFTDEEEKEIAELYLSGVSTREIAKRRGLSHHISIVSALRRQGVEQRSAPERNRLYSLNPQAFDQIDNEQAAYFWGYLYADGSINKRTLTIGLARKDEVLLHRIKHFIQSEAPIKATQERLSSDGPLHQKSIVQITDRYLADRLREMGIMRDRLKPDLVFNQLPRELTHHWIRGYFDGDGSARKSPSIAFVGQQRLLEWMREVFARDAGTNPNLAVSKHRTANIYYLFISGRRQALKVVEYMYRDATIWLERKREVIDNWPLPQVRYRNEKGQWK